MKKILLLFFIFTVHLSANVFQLSTVVDNQELIPVIKINGKIVIEVKNVGTKQVFSSVFERSEKIYNSLRQINSSKSSLSRIKIRRNKTDRQVYVAYVDNIELYRVTPSDVLGSDLTVYQMAVLWRKNIVEALSTSPIITKVDSENQAFKSSPLIPFLSIFTNNSVFVMVMQFLLFLTIQVIAIILTFRIANRRHKIVFEEFHKRMKKFHNHQIRDKNMIQTLENRIIELTKKLDQNHKADNISNIK